MTSRVTTDYEAMAQAGVQTIVEPAFWLGEERKHSSTFLDYFQHMVGFEVKRAASYGIDRYVALGLNPKESNNESLAKEVLKELPRFLDHPRVVAVGEIGFDSLSDLEVWSMTEQIKMAAERKLPLQIHAPHMDKARGVTKSLQIVKDMGFPMERTLIDHSVEDTTAEIREAGAWTGLTVYPITKLTPERAANILQEHGLEKMMIHSSADWGPSDPLMVIHTISELRRRKIKEDEIQKLVWDSPYEFFAQSGRLR
jgi:predicted metal-dependent TIM-barrel fold hydrolase